MDLRRVLIARGTFRVAFLALLITGRHIVMAVLAILRQIDAIAM